MCLISIIAVFLYPLWIMPDLSNCMPRWISVTSTTLSSFWTVSRLSPLAFHYCIFCRDGTMKHRRVDSFEMFRSVLLLFARESSLLPRLRSRRCKRLCLLMWMRIFCFLHCVLWLSLTAHRICRLRNITFPTFARKTRPTTQYLFQSYYLFDGGAVNHQDY